MKLMYLASLKFDFDKLDGVQKKIINQINTLSKYFDIDLICCSGDHVCIYNIKNNKIVNCDHYKNKFDIYKTILSMNLNQYKGIYIRYPNSDFMFIKLLKHLKRKHFKIVLEIPTFPYDAEGKENLKGRIISYIDRFYRKKLHKYIDRIVTFSKDEYIFNIKTIRTINGIDFNKIEMSGKEVNVKKEIKLIAVSGMYRVHGFERLINGINTYYLNGGKREIFLHLIGAGPEYNKYQTLISDYNLQKRVFLHGMLYDGNLNSMYDDATMGINSLAIHRQNLEFESTLKTREYAAKGLPMLSSSFVDALSIEDNSKYVYKIPADETEVNVFELIKFIDDLYNKNDYRELRKTIRNNAKKNCDMSITLSPIIDFFE